MLGWKVKIKGACMDTTAGLEHLATSKPVLAQDIIEKARDALKQQSWPGPRQENWRYSNTHKLFAQKDWALAGGEVLDQGAFVEQRQPSYRLVFAGGVLQAALSDLEALAACVQVYQQVQDMPEDMQKRYQYALEQGVDVLSMSYMMVGMELGAE